MITAPKTCSKTPDMALPAAAGELTDCAFWDHAVSAGETRRQACKRLERVLQQQGTFTLSVDLFGSPVLLRLV